MEITRSKANEKLYPPGTDRHKRNERKTKNQTEISNMRTEGKEVTLKNINIPFKQPLHRWPT